MNVIRAAGTTLVVNDGREIKLTLDFYHLFLLREKNPGVYKDTSRILIQGFSDLMEYSTVAYAAYLCANMESDEAPASFVDFLEWLPEINKVADTVAGLVNGTKKPTASATPSETRPGVDSGAE